MDLPIRGIGDSKVAFEAVSRNFDLTGQISAVLHQGNCTVLDLSVGSEKSCFTPEIQTSKPLWSRDLPAPRVFDPCQIWCRRRIGFALFSGRSRYSGLLVRESVMSDRNNWRDGLRQAREVNYGGRFVPTPIPPAWIRDFACTHP